MREVANRPFAGIGAALGGRDHPNGSPRVAQDGRRAVRGRGGAARRADDRRADPAGAAARRL